MIYFLDASALVKRYVAEPGAEVVRSLVRKRRKLAASTLSAVEVPAALFRRARLGDLETETAGTLAERLSFDMTEMTVVEVRAQVLQIAAALVATHPLRAYDAIQLACALRLARSTRLPVRFGCADVHLRRAAKAEGLKLLPLA